MNNGEVQKLIDLFNDNKELYELTEYQITEHFNTNGDTTYLVHNLDAETEDGEIYFGDIEGKILNNRYTLMGFLINSIQDIKFEKDLIAIKLVHGDIKIQIIR